MHSFVMVALHEHMRMNFDFMAIEHMLATQSLPPSIFHMLVGVGDHIGPGKIYNQHTLVRMGGQDNSDEEGDYNDEQEEMNGSEEESGSKMEVERIRRETRRKKRQERMEEGSFSGIMNQATLLEAKDLGDHGKMKEKRSSH
ncbi:hypothetical protein M9H77_31137 [Catharanthus roseus]|uniref:Uncharacterized protein n=1 Tax=Catharanthus roseus TaxID=4058 RepID=A0ACB9ZZ70_CATRO|nr:hypothetical protein M9H77_31137 [Catharanthus roseus]